MGLIETIIEIGQSIWDSITSIFGSNPVNKTTQRCPLPSGVMTPEQAQAYMNKFKSTDIPFDYPVDCCYARARVMCGDMERDGIKCQKYWYAGSLAPVNSNGTPVTFPSPSNPVTWGYHVAPLVQVQQPDGTVKKMILDPSISDTPLTIPEWQARCNPRSSNPIEYTSDSTLSFPFNNSRTAVLPDPKVNGTMTEEQAKNQLEIHKRQRDLAKLSTKPI